MPQPKKYHSREERLEAKRRLEKAARAKDPARHKRKLMEYHYLTKYGLTIEQRDLMLESQGGCCALCPRKIRFKGRGYSNAHVDHVHGTKQVRGILCGRCNVALGSFGDNAEGLQKALDYVNGRFRAEPAQRRAA